MTQTDETLAYEILNALCQSSLSDELQYYREHIQKDLKLSEDVMNRLYSLPVITALLSPKIQPIKTYKGEQVYPKKSEPISQSKYVCDGNVCKLVSEEREEVSKFINEDDFAPENKVKEEEAPQEVPQEKALQEEPSEKHTPLEAQQDNESSSSSSSGDESTETESETSSSHKPSITPTKALKKIFRKNEVDYSSFSFDTETNPNTLIVKGVPKVHEDLMRKSTGQWKGGKKYWIFGNQKLVDYVNKMYNED